MLTKLFSIVCRSFVLLAFHAATRLQAACATETKNDLSDQERPHLYTLITAKTNTRSIWLESIECFWLITGRTRTQIQLVNLFSNCARCFQLNREKKLSNSSNNKLWIEMENEKEQKNANTLLATRTILWEKQLKFKHPAKSSNCCFNFVVVFFYSRLWFIQTIYFEWFIANVKNSITII